MRNQWRRLTLILLLALLFAFLFGVMTSPTSPKHTLLRQIHVRIRQFFFMLFPFAEDCHFEPNAENLYLGVHRRGRLGNHMFQYAALVAIAKANNRVAVLPENFYELRDHFNIAREPCFWRPDNRVLYNEVITNVGSSLHKMEALPRANITLIGYFQSFRYFDAIKRQIREEFTFRKHIRDTAISIIRLLTPQHWQNTAFQRVGIHVRRGDLLLKQFQDMGFIDPGIGYYRRAMAFFIQRYEHVQFIIASDDIPWCKTHLTISESPESVNVAFLEGDNAAVEDMAVLVMCDDVITSQGTFSWWIGWLNHGVTTYPASYPPPNMLTSKMHEPKYYYPNDEFNTWVPL